MSNCRAQYSSCYMLEQCLIQRQRQHFSQAWKQVHSVAPNIKVKVNKTDLVKFNLDTTFSSTFLIVVYLEVHATKGTHR